MVIPKLSEEYVKQIDEINESLAALEDEQQLGASNSTTPSKINSISSSFHSSASGGGKKPSVRKPLMRSSTENFISSLARANLSAPFSSILVPLTIHDRLDEEDDHETTSNAKPSKTLANHTLSATASRNDLDIIAKRQDRLSSTASQQLKPVSSQKHVYSLDFLLSRAEVESAKKMPNNWRELSSLYPNICFSGKVKTPNFFNSIKILTTKQNVKFFKINLFFQGPFLFQSKQIL